MCQTKRLIKRGDVFNWISLLNEGEEVEWRKEKEFGVVDMLLEIQSTLGEFIWPKMYLSLLFSKKKKDVSLSSRI